jgi:hypothetical protein
MNDWNLGSPRIHSQPRDAFTEVIEEWTEQGSGPSADDDHFRIEQINNVSEP